MRWHLKSPASPLFVQPFVPAWIKENIKAPRHWSLWKEPTGDWWIPSTKVQLRWKCFHLMISSWIHPDTFMNIVTKLLSLLFLLTREIATWESQRSSSAIGLSAVSSSSWSRHEMETFSALWAICAGNSPVPGEFPAERPVTRSFNVFFDQRLKNGWVNNLEAGDVRRYRAHYDVIVIITENPYTWNVGLYIETGHLSQSETEMGHRFSSQCI